MPWWTVYKDYYIRTQECPSSNKCKMFIYSSFWFSLIVVPAEKCWTEWYGWCISSRHFFRDGSPLYSSCWNTWPVLFNQLQSFHNKLDLWQIAYLQHKIRTGQNWPSPNKNPAGYFISRIKISARSALQTRLYKGVTARKRVPFVSDTFLLNQENK